LAKSLGRIVLGVGKEHAVQIPIAEAVEQVFAAADRLGSRNCKY
jgi:hypothetical protein